MTTQSLLLTHNGWVPNNENFPLLVYRNVEQGDPETIAQAFEARFKRHGWPPLWRDTVYDYHHYHSKAHEALGVSSGSARVMFGGPGGSVVEIEAGDAVVIPAGVGHCRISASDDFLVVGAYPEGQELEILREAPSETALRTIVGLPRPTNDPVKGADSLMAREWHAR